MGKYQDLVREMKRLWKIETRVIPIVIGNDTKRSGREPESIGINIKVELIQKVALLGQLEY